MKRGRGVESAGSVGNDLVQRKKGDIRERSREMQWQVDSLGGKQ